MNKFVVLALVLIGASLALTGCFNKKEVVPTPVSAPVPEVTAPKVNLVAYPLDLEKSTVAWMGQKIIVKMKETGNIKIKEGKLEFDGDKLIGGRFILDMNTIETNSQYGEMKAKLEEHLKSVDFFDVVNSPLSELVIKSAVIAPETATTTPEVATSTVATDKPVNYLVTADLTIKGITKSVEFPAELTKVGNDIKAIAKLKIDRSLWDIRYGSGTFFTDLGDKVIDNEIGFDINLLAIGPVPVVETTTSTTTVTTTATTTITQ